LIDKKESVPGRKENQTTVDQNKMIPNGDNSGKRHRRAHLTICLCSIAMRHFCLAFHIPSFYHSRAFGRTLEQRMAMEHIPAVYEMSDIEVDDDRTIPEALIVRPLLKHTQLESRPLKVVYNAEQDGWDPTTFHKAVDGKGAALILAKAKDCGKLFGGYNPKGFASFGGARPSIAAFLFYEIQPGKFQKLQKVGGAKLACARDDPDFGISFGTDDLIIGLQPQQERLAQSKLGQYYESGPEQLSSLFGVEYTEVDELKVLVGCYEDSEEIPYSGEVLDSFQFTNDSLEESIYFN
jgi:hypothetical protein